MSYGVKVLNADGRTLLNSDELAPNTFITGKTASAYSSMVYPPVGFTTGDLALAKPASSPVYSSSTNGGSVPISASGSYSGSQRFWGSSSHPSYFFQNTAGISTALVRTQSGNISAPSSGEYGLDVYAPNGTTILFSATRSTSVKILATGVLSSNQDFTYTPPSSLDFSKIYAVCNSSMLYAIPQVFVFPSWVLSMSYTFFPNHSSPYIRVRNRTDMGGSTLTTNTALFPYMIVYDPN
jgi:hypothetical protein